MAGKDRDATVFKLHVASFSWHDDASVKGPTQTF